MMVKPPSVDCLYRKAVASLKSGDLNGAARCYGSALELDPTHLPALNNLAAMRAALGHAAAAMGMHSLFCSRTHQAGGGYYRARTYRGADLCGYSGKPHREIGVGPLGPCMRSFCSSANFRGMTTGPAIQSSAGG